MVSVQKDRSTETHIIQTVHDISKSLNEKTYVDMAILDLTKAFDKDPHKRVIHKLQILWHHRPNIVRDRKLPCRKNSTGCNKWISIHTDSSHLYGTTNVRIFVDECLLYLPVKSDNDISLLLLKLNSTKCFTTTLVSRDPTPNLYPFCGQIF